MTPKRIFAIPFSTQMAPEQVNVATARGASVVFSEKKG
jgi:hypothetical protein